ncbi:MAG TPA: hypothetical protein VFF53_03475 [Geobacteraceae bacterium]|nr:hypothetical protein [Aquabacterium sp.]HZV81210.1 hypothetical protein [Geobacteraceae bacterium]
MAERSMEHLPAPGGRKRFDEYPWDEWLKPSKKPLTLQQGVDFDVHPTSMRAYVYRAAAEREVPVKTVRSPGGKLHLQVPIPESIAEGKDT